MNRRRLTLILALGALLGCGDFTGRIDGEVIDAQGGELRADRTVVRLVPGAVDTAIVARIDLLAAADLPGFADAVTQPLRVEPVELSLAQPCEITFDYSGMGVAPEILTIVRIDHVESALVPLPDQRIDPDTQTLTAELNQLGEFALLAECAPGDCPMGDDEDADGVIDAEDNCPQVANPDQLDTDGNGIGDVCDAAPDDEICDDGLDNDSDGLIDEDCGSACMADNDCAPGQQCVAGICAL